MIEPVRAFPAFPPRANRQWRAQKETRLFPLDGSTPCVPYRFGRAAIHRGLLSLGVGRGDTVLMPAYHHGVEVEVVRSLGARVRFYPVEQDLSLRLEAIEEQVDDDTRVLFVVHYFGLPQPLAELRRFCRERALLLFEDCSLALLSADGAVPLGSVGDASAFCLYKTLPVPDGGLLVLNGRTDRPPAPANRLDGRILVSEMHALVRQRPRRLPVRASSTAGATSSWDHPEQAGYPFFVPLQLDRSISPVTRLLLPGFDLVQVRDHRRWAYAWWSDLLGDRVHRVRPELPPGACPLLFPILVDDKRALHDALLREGIELHNWWSRWYGGAPEGELPDADHLKRHLLGLPVHQNLSAADLDRIGRALRRHLPARV